MINNVLGPLFKNPVMANLLMAMIVLSGVMGALSMTREIFPRFSLDQINVTVAYPGADPEEIEEGICLKLEEVLDGIEGVKEVITIANEGMGQAIVRCQDDANIYEVKDEVKTLVDAITTFPDDAEKPIVSEVKFKGDVLAIAIWGDLPERQLKEIARQTEDELSRLPEISQTSIGGVRDYQISIEVSEDTLRSYGLGFDDIGRAVAKSGLNLPSGAVKTRDEDFRVRAIGRRYHAQDYRDIPVIAKRNGAVVTLGQLANIRDDFDEDAKVFAFFNGKRAVTVNVYKTEEEDAIAISKAVDRYLNEKRKSLPPTLNMTKFTDNSRFVRDRLNMLIDNGLMGLCLVVLSLWLFLDFRLSFWVAMGIPISISGALALMALLGCSINMLSMFGMIMVLGLIVDDAIVVGESIYSRRQSGDSCLDAAVNGTAEVAFPVIASVTTTIVAFLPLFFIGDVMGKFIRQIPIPVVTALSVSMIEALFILPVHLRHLPLAPEKASTAFFFSRWLRHLTIGSMNWFLERIYGPGMDTLLRNRYFVISAAVAAMLIMIGLFQGGYIRREFFPETDDDFLRAKLELPPGTPIEKTRLAGERLLNGWKEVEKKYPTASGKPLTVALFSLIGSSIDPSQTGSQGNALEMAVELLPSEERGPLCKTLALAWQDAVGEVPGAVSATFGAFDNGPGGSPIEVLLYGNDHTALIAGSDALVAKLQALEGVFNARSDYRPGKREFLVKIKPEAAHLGLTLDDVARHIHDGFYGDEALRVQRERDDIKVKVRYPEKNGRDSISCFKNLIVTTSDGRKIPFLSVANIEVGTGQSVINRKDRDRVVTVSADIDPRKSNAHEVLSSLQADFLPQLLDHYGLTYSVGGQAEEVSDSFSTLKITFPLALFGIYFIIASIFRSYLQPIVIMLTIPFGLMGGALGHVICGLPLSLMSMFGMVALAGIVVNDAIVLIEGINVRLAEGAPLFEALREGGKRRFRAIMLTTITTFFGLMPLILEKSMQAQFLVPMAVSIAFGVLFSTGVTLALIPCVVAALNDFRRGLYYLWFLRMPSREEIEPRAALGGDGKRSKE